MSDIWNKMIHELNNFSDTIAEKSEEYFKYAVEKGEEISKKGKIQFDIERIKRELKKEKFNLGNFIEKEFHHENVTDFTLNEQFHILMEKILNLKKIIISLEKEKEDIVKNVANNEKQTDKNTDIKNDYSL